MYCEIRYYVLYVYKTLSFFYFRRIIIKLDKAMKRFDDMKKKMKDLQPFAEQKWKKITEHIQHLEKFIKEGLERVDHCDKIKKLDSEVQALDATTKKINNDVRRIDREVDELKKKVNDIHKIDGDVHDNIKKINNDVRRIDGNVNQINKKLNDVGKAGDIHESIKKINNDVRRIDGNTQEISIKLKKETQKLRGDIKQFDGDIQKLHKKNEKNINEVKEGFHKSIKELERKNREQQKKIQKELKQKLENLQKKNKQRIKQINQINYKIHKFQQSIEKVSERFKYEIQKQQKLQKQLLDVNSSVSQIVSNISPIIQSSKIKAILQEEKEEERIKKKKQEESERARKEEQLKKILEKMKVETAQELIDQTTPYAKNFLLEGNRVTLENQVGWYQQLLLDKVIGREEPFKFHVHIKYTQEGKIGVGVVDLLSQKQAQYSSWSGNAVCYCGDLGRIHYGHQKQHQDSFVDVYAHSDMEISVIVDLTNRIVTFIFKQTDGTIHKHSVESDILGELTRQFVPFFQISRKGEAISWCIE